jgi:hypothetical protein
MHDTHHAHAMRLDLSTKLRAIGASLCCGYPDRTVQYWTIPNENKFYDIRDSLPFPTLYCGPQPGGLVVYLDKARYDTHRHCQACGQEIPEAVYCRQCL